MASDLEKKIIQQIEYYFGDFNLRRDKFLKEKIGEDEGWVTLEVLLTFKRLSSLSTDEEVIAAAVEKSENKLVELSEDRRKIRRNPEKPLPESDEQSLKQVTERSAYAKGFPLDASLDDILSFLEPHGPIESCHRRTINNQKFKGSCFIVFKENEACKKFVEAESIKYNDVELIRKFQQVYWDDKKKEIEERKKNKKEKKEKDDSKEPPKKLDFPKGAILHFTGLEEGHSLTREELKDRIKEVGDLEVAFMDFKKGDLEGYARFPEENGAVEFLKKMTDNQLTVDKFTMKLRVLEGEEEEEYLQKSSDAILELRKKQKMSSRNSRKRKGNFGSHGGRDGKQKRY
ncbi:la autoantigen-like [Leptinotarsa decemlineata]|uniref:la autoantigen-like n=1 Tax=Leptinotarsa decemlineata TaxID=7539 RepID=UPI003D30A7CC